MERRRSFIPKRPNSRIHDLVHIHRPMFRHDLEFPILVIKKKNLPYPIFFSNKPYFQVHGRTSRRARRRRPSLHQNNRRPSRRHPMLPRRSPILFPFRLGPPENRPRPRHEPHRLPSKRSVRPQKT